jgi:hypothetical protein
MPIFFGVDSARAVDQSLITAVVAKTGRKPDFWLRYLTTGGAGATPVTKEEIDFLHGEGIAVGLVYNGVTRADLEAGKDGAVACARDAEDRAARALGLNHTPTRSDLGVVVVYADIESGWPLTAEWLLTWADPVRYGLLGFTPGVYLPYKQDGYRAALAAVDKKAPPIHVWGAAWIAENADTAPLPAWPADAVPGMFLWQYAGNMVGGLVDFNIALTLQGMLQPPKPKPTPPPPPVNTSSTEVVLADGRRISSGLIVNGVTIAPVRAVAEALGATVDFDPQKGVVITPPK